MPDFFQLIKKDHLLFKRIPITIQKARSLDSVGNTLFTRAITLPLFSRLVTFGAIKNETHNKGWKVNHEDEKFHRFLIRPSKQIYYIGSYAFAMTMMRKQSKGGILSMTIKTWKQQMEERFTPQEIARFNELYELHASSMQFERIAISNDEVNFVDSSAAGPVEDIVLKPKAAPSPQDNASPVTYAIFLNVSDYEQIVFELISLAKRHDFDIERMLNEMQEDSERYDCENILFPSIEGEISL